MGNNQNNQPVITTFSLICPKDDLNERTDGQTVTVAAGVKRQALIVMMTMTYPYKMWYLLLPPVNRKCCGPFFVFLSVLTVFGFMSVNMRQDSPGCILVGRLKRD